MFKISAFRAFAFFLAFFVVSSINPYYLWGYERIGFSVFISILLIVIFFVRKGFSKDRVLISFLFFIIVFFYKILIGASFFGALVFATSLALILSVNDNILIKVVRYVKLFLAVILCPAIILWLLHHSIDKSVFYLGNISPDIIPNKGKVELGEGYALYPFTVVLDYMLLDPIYRMAGPFDEPGVVGTIAALLLAAGKFDYKEKVNIILFISGLLSFSLAFYVISFVYFTLMSIRHIKVFFMLMTFLILLAFSASINETVKRYTFDRIFLSGENIAGDNRAGESLNNSFDIWLHSSGYDLMFGVSYEADGSSSIKIIPVQSGVVGVILFLMIFSITLAVFRNSINITWFLFVFIICYFLSVYQRPDVVSPIYYLIFIAGIINSKMINDISQAQKKLV